MRIRFLPLLFTTLSMCLVGCTINNSGDINSDQSDKGVSITNFTKTDDGFLGKIDNSVETFSFINRVNVPKNASWYIYRDVTGTNEIPTKTIQCNVGDNIVYLLVNGEKESIGFYKVNVHRFDMYTVTFNSNGGSYVEPQKVQEESLIKPFNNPTKAGYDFKNWDYDFNSPVMSDLLVSAIWEGKEYTVTFNVNGGNPLDTSSMKVKYGSQYSLPTPERSYYTFKNWSYQGRSLSSGVWNIESDVELIAEWEPESYPIRYSLNGGINNATNPSSYTIETPTFTISNPTKDGHSFKGWSVNGGSELIINPEITKGSHGAIDLSAAWDAQSYKITLIAPGSDCDNQKIDVKYGETVNLPTPHYSDSNYTFGGWMYESQEITNPFVYNYASDISVTALKSGKKVNAFLEYSSTKSNGISLIYNVNGTEYKREALNEIDSIPYPFYEYSSYSFDDGKDFFMGWYQDSSFSNYYNFSENLSQSKTLYGKFIKSSSLGVTSSSRIATFNGRMGSNVSNNGKGSYIYYLYTGEIDTYTMLPYLSSTSDGTGLRIEFETISQSPTSGTKQSFSYSGWSRYASNVSYDEKTITLKKNAIYTITFIGSSYGATSYTLGSQSFFINLYPSLNKTNVKASKFSSSVSIEYGKQFDLGIPNVGGSNFVGWSKTSDGNSLVTDSTGKSLSVSNFTSDTQFYPVFNMPTAKYECTYNESGSYYSISKCKENTTSISLISVFNDGTHGLAPVKEIKANAFSSSQNTENLVVPNTIRYMNAGCLRYLGKLKTLSLPFIGNQNEYNFGINKYPLGYLFGTNSFTGAELTTMSYVGTNTSEYSTVSGQFYIPTSLKDLYVEGGNLSVGALMNCKYLETVKLGDGVKRIEKSAVLNCVCINSFYIGDCVEQIDSNAFAISGGVNPQLTKVFIPLSVKTMGAYAFNGYSSVKKYYAEATKRQSGWSSDWFDLSFGATVSYGYTREQFDRL